MGLHVDCGVLQYQASSLHNTTRYQVPASIPECSQRIYYYVVFVVCTHAIAETI